MAVTTLIILMLILAALHAIEALTLITPVSQNAKSVRLDMCVQEVLTQQRLLMQLLIMDTSVLLVTTAQLAVSKKESATQALTIPSLASQPPLTACPVLKIPTMIRRDRVAV